MDLKIALLPGDGIGPEVTYEAIKILEAIADKYKHNFEFEKALVGAIAIEKTGNPLPNETLKICSESDAILFGAIGDPKYDNNPTSKVRPEQGLLKLRKSLGIFANIRPISTYEPLLHKSNLKEHVIKGANFVIYRELSNGIYYGDKSLSTDGKTAIDTCIYNIDEIDNIAHLAFKAAAKSRRKKLTLIDKSNVLETSKLWRKRVIELSKSYPEVNLKFLYVDNAAMQIISNPRQFDVILTENMFGDILSDEASIISGSIGLLASASIGKHAALFEPIHGSYPQAKGKNIANPIGSILSAAMLLEHFDLNEEAQLIRDAVEKSLFKNICTVDINQDSLFKTDDIGEFIVDYIQFPQDYKVKHNNVKIGQSTII